MWFSEGKCNLGLAFLFCFLFLHSLSISALLFSFTISLYSISPSTQFADVAGIAHLGLWLVDSGSKRQLLQVFKGVWLEGIDSNLSQKQNKDQVMNGHRTLLISPWAGSETS